MNRQFRRTNRRDAVRASAVRSNRIEQLEPRLLLSGIKPLAALQPASIDSILGDTAVEIELGPQTGVTDQPFLEFEALDQGTGLGPYGSASGLYPYNRVLLDTGANSIIVASEPAEELITNGLKSEGGFIEKGVAGDADLLVSAACEIRFEDSAGNSHSLPQTADDARILLGPNEAFADTPASSGGIPALLGMPVMAGRVTSFDVRHWADVDDYFELLPMEFRFTTGPDAVPPTTGRRVTVAVDDRVSFDPHDGLPPGSPPNAPVPVWAPVPFLTATAVFDNTSQQGNFLFDTGAQLSILSSDMAFSLGLDEDGSGTFDEEKAADLPVGGLGGMIEAPLLVIDEIRVPTVEGVELAWRDTGSDPVGLEVVIIDIVSGIDGVFGIDLLTSGIDYTLDPVTFEFPLSGSTYFERSHLDFRGIHDGIGYVHLDLHPDYVPPAVTGVYVRGSGWTPAFLDGLDQQGLGHPLATIDPAYARLGYRIPDGPAQGDALPWTDVDAISVALSEPVDVLDTDLSLTGAQSGAVPLSGGFSYDAAATTATWTLSGPLSADRYTLTLQDTVDLDGEALDGEWQASADEYPSGDFVPGGSFVFAFDFGADVVARHVFYNDSAFDDGPAANAADDGAIAPGLPEASDPQLGKTALMPGGQATFQNATSYDKGLNGIMIDVLGLGDAGNLSAADFQFRMGNDDDPSGWADAPPPSSVTVRPGAGDGGSDRITLIWPNYDPTAPDPTTQAVAGQWLEVTMLPTANTGLTAADVFYFGNALGDSGTGNTDELALVSAIDFGAVRDNPHSPNDPAAIDDFADYNRDTLVNAIDFGLVRDNPTNPNTALKFVSVPAASAPAASAPVLSDAAFSETDDVGDLSVDLGWLVGVDTSDHGSRATQHADPAREAVERLLATW